MHDDIRRADAEDALGHPLHDEEWSRLTYLLKSRDGLPDEITSADLAGLYRDYTRAGLLQAPHEPEPPTWWVERSSSVLEGFRWLGDQAKAALGLKRPLEVDAVGGLLREVATYDLPTGDSISIEYPQPGTYESGVPAGLEWWLASGPRLVHAYRGYAETAREAVFEQAAVEALGGGRGSPGQESALDVAQKRADEWAVARISKLGLLDRAVSDIVEATSCKRWQAVGFLLCDRPFALPWVEVSTAWGGALAMAEAGPPEPRFTVSVGSPRVSAPDVASAYRYVQNRYLYGAQAGSVRSRTVVSRNERLLAFVRDDAEHNSRVSWPRRLASWNAQPDLPPGDRFKTAESMRVTHSKARRAQEAAADGGNSGLGES